MPDSSANENNRQNRHLLTRGALGIHDRQAKERGTVGRGKKREMGGEKGKGSVKRGLENKGE